MNTRSYILAALGGAYVFVLPFFIGPWLWLASGLIFPAAWLLQRQLKR